MLEILIHLWKPCSIRLLDVIFEHGFLYLLNLRLRLTRHQIIEEYFVLAIDFILIFPFLRFSCSAGWCSASLALLFFIDITTDSLHTFLLLIFIIHDYNLFGIFDVWWADVFYVYSLFADHILDRAYMAAMTIVKAFHYFIIYGFLILHFLFFFLLSIQLFLPLLFFYVWH